MRYVDYQDYIGIYGDDITVADFNRIGFDAERLIDKHTTGLDGIKKLRVAFPADEDDAEAVRYTIYKLIQALKGIEDAQAAASYQTRADGSLTSKTIVSVSSGSESISYGTSGVGSSAVLAAAADEGKRKQLINGIIRDGLSGVTDANGVNLLYMGVYPLVQ